jgi:hypothetical protein
MEKPSPSICFPSLSHQPSAYPGQFIFLIKRSSDPHFVTVAQGDQMSFGKIVQNVFQPIFVNT